MRSEQPSFTDVEYQNRRRVSRREEFLVMMDQTVPWQRWVELIEPHHYTGKRAVNGSRWRRCCVVAATGRTVEELFPDVPPVTERDVAATIAHLLHDESFALNGADVPVL